MDFVPKASIYTNFQQNLTGEGVRHWVICQRMTLVHCTSAASCQLVLLVNVAISCILRHCNLVVISHFLYVCHVLL